MNQTIFRVLLAVVLLLIGIIKMDNASSLEVLLYRVGPNWSFDTFSFLARFIVSTYWISALLLLPRVTAKSGKVLAFLVLTIAMIFAVISLAYPTLDIYFGASRTFKLPAIINISIHIMLLLLLLFVRTPATKAKQQTLILLGIGLLVLLLLPNLLSLPSVYGKSLNKKIEYSDSTLQAEIQSGNIPLEFVSGKKVLPFYSVNCRFCRYSAERLSALFEKENLPLTDMNIVFWATKVDPTLFYEITNSKAFNFTPVPTKPFMKIVNGRMPLILLVENGNVIERMRYNNLDERKIKHWLLAE